MRLYKNSGKRKVVEIPKRYSEDEGGGCSIFITSLGNERGILMKHLDATPAAIAAAQKLKPGTH